MRVDLPILDIERVRPALLVVQSWTSARLSSGQLAPWEDYQIRKLRETVDEVIDGGDAVDSAGFATDDSPASPKGCSPQEARRSGTPQGDVPNAVGFELM